MVIVSLLFSIIICFGIPIGGVVLFLKKGNSTGKTVVFGALAFFISQICIRLPILTAIADTAWYALLQYKPALYALFLGGTAGIAEECARWVFLKFALKRSRTMNDGILFGLGHGGIEAILLVGINQVVYLLMILFGQGELLQLETLHVMLAGVERLSVMAFHVGATLVVLHGICNAKDGRYLLLAILLHTVADAALVILPAYFGIGILGVEVWCLLMGIGCLLVGIRLFSKKHEKIGY